MWMSTAEMNLQNSYPRKSNENRTMSRQHYKTKKCHKLFTRICGIFFKCGAGGIRTHVQTGKPYAFYTFIPAFGFRATARPGPPTGALASKISSCCRGPARLFPIYLHRLILRFGTTSLERCLVPSSDDGIKPVIYCTSIRQRERNCFRQLNFCSLRLKS